MTSCADAPKDPYYYANYFYADANKYGADPAIVTFEVVDNLRNRGEKAVGVCQCGINNILLDRAAWYGYEFERRRALVYHEMGHCSLGIGCSGPGHPDNGVIMRPAMAGPSFYSDDWDSKVQTLFLERR